MAYMSRAFAAVRRDDYGTLAIMFEAMEKAAAEFKVPATKLMTIRR
jgi:hypothetical protein